MALLPTDNRMFLIVLQGGGGVAAEPQVSREKDMMVIGITECDTSEKGGGVIQNS